MVLADRPAIIVDEIFTILVLMLTCLLLDVMSRRHLVKGVLRVRAKLDMARNLRLVSDCRR